MDGIEIERMTASALTAEAAEALLRRGFVVLPGPVPFTSMAQVADAYDAAMLAAASSDVHVGSTTTRVNDFVNRGAHFEALYTFPPLLQASCRVIGPHFKLSSMHARTLRPQATAQALHVDVPRESADWPLVGFIWMIDGFRVDNGATRFIPGSHHWLNTPDMAMIDCCASREDEVVAIGPAGSVIVFHGSAWHGYTANTTLAPRRSIQGAFIPRRGNAGTNFVGRMPAEARERLDAVARYVLAVDGP